MAYEPEDVLKVKGDDGEVEVVTIEEESAGDFEIPGLDQTVAEYNDCDADETVYSVVYTGGRSKNTYAFPECRLET